MSAKTQENPVFINEQINATWLYDGLFSLQEYSMQYGPPKVLSQNDHDYVTACLTNNIVRT